MSHATSRSRRLLRLAAVVPALLGVLLAAPAFAKGGGGGGGGGGNQTTAPNLRSVTFAPATVVGGGASTGTATFVASASQGAVVNLSSSDPAVLTVPTEAVVRPGQSSTAFPVATQAVTAATTVTVTASAFGTTTVTATITVTPGTPPAKDTVRITLAQWKTGHLKIQATSSNPNAVLTVSLGFALTNNGGGSYSDERNWLDNPRQITVTSNFGGSATATVTG
ncbi:hypothetical protein GCM10023322_34750 [Rugosimonospora acidiphila]|uniref:Uncharacterized protein n=1 Tax=Rugosimonospora acidiphila TaxID=556531 RepID=A0ABP9RW73_9ACTN